ncbi:MAG: hypothetical protein KKE56_06805 [Actinobacteria bacterium]|nr:hypothetical protein [Actinomycetota bacterium]
MSLSCMLASDQCETSFGSAKRLRGTQLERIMSRVKRMLSFERFYARGKKALQGFADRYVTVFNIIAYAAWSI